MMGAKHLKERSIQLDWPCGSGVQWVTLPPSRGPNSLFSGFRISRVFPIYSWNGPLILVLVERVDIPNSFNIGFFESARMDSDSEDHIYRLHIAKKSHNV